MTDSIKKCTTYTDMNSITPMSLTSNVCWKEMMISKFFDSPFYSNSNLKIEKIYNRRSIKMEMVK
jgi:hypothetical protein